ncbi:MAG: PEP-CTERM sorting domain-containing protein [Phycisphaerae bacterium]|nr:PEP-CTERM sorting domain-containing protein [Phycisphaerae bacterium]
MRKATLVLIAVVTASCLIVSQEVSAAEYQTGPVEFENGLVIHNGKLNLGGDSFFDVFADQGGTFAVDSFFDVFTEVGAPPAGADPPPPVQLTGPVTVVVGPRNAGDPPEMRTFDTEIISMSLSGDVGGLPIVIGESPSLASTGHTTITDLGNGQFQIDSFFDVFTELSVDTGPFMPQLNGPTRIELIPPPPPEIGVQRCDDFYGQLTSSGVSNGGGTGWDGSDADAEGDWITYPNSGDGGPPWINQWFYNDPFDPNRWKEVYWDIVITPLDPGGANNDIVEIAINWSNGQHPDGSGQPPMPNEEPAIERAIIWTTAGGVPSDIPGFVEIDPHTGDIILKNRPEDGTPFIIPDYNPEWVSIDVRMLDQLSDEGVMINGQICHQCVPEPATMSLLALGGLAVLRRRRRRA